MVEKLQNKQNIIYNFLIRLNNEQPHIKKQKNVENRLSIFLIPEYFF